MKRPLAISNVIYKHELIVNTIFFLYRISSVMIKAFTDVASIFEPVRHKVFATI